MLEGFQRALAIDADICGEVRLWIREQAFEVADFLLERGGGGAFCCWGCEFCGVGVGVVGVFSAVWS